MLGGGGGGGGGVLRGLQRSFSKRTLSGLAKYFIGQE